MAKIMGAILVIVACMGWAQKIIIKQKKSVSELFNIISGLREIADSIYFLKRPLPEIICSLNGEKSEFFSKIAEIISQDDKTGVEKAWEKAMEDKNIPISDRAREILSNLGKMIGKQTAGQEEENINMCVSELMDILKSEEEILTKNTKMIQSFGILSGLMTVILFI